MCYTGLIMNNALLGVKIPESMLRELKYKYPDVKVRNNVLRGLIQKLLDGKVIINSYELRLPRTT